MYCASLVKSNTQSSNQKRRTAMFNIPTNAIIKIVKEVVKIIVGGK